MHDTRPGAEIIGNTWVDHARNKGGAKSLAWRTVNYKYSKPRKVLKSYGTRRKGRQKTPRLGIKLPGTGAGAPYGNPSNLTEEYMS